MDRKCPHCKVGTVQTKAAWGRQIIFELKNIPNPLNSAKIVWTTFSPLYRQFFQGMKVVSDDYICKSCKGVAVICPTCSTIWAIPRVLESAEVVECPSCKQKLVFD